MSQAALGNTTIPSTAHPRPENPLDTIVHKAGEKLSAFMMTRLVGDPDVRDAHSLTRDLLDIARVVDEMLLAIGHEAKSHFGSGVDLGCFADQMLGAIEGNATYEICEAAQDYAMAADDAAAEHRREFLQAAE